MYEIVAFQAQWLLSIYIFDFIDFNLSRKVLSVIDCLIVQLNYRNVAKMKATQFKGALPY